MAKKPALKISNLEKVQEALLASELKYRRLFETAKDGILVLDALTGKIVDVNPFLVNLLGYPHDHFIANAIWDIGFFKDIIANQKKFLELKKRNTYGMKTFHWRQPTEGKLMSNS